MRTIWFQYYYFRHVITVVAARSYFLLQSLDSKSNEPCFPHEVLVLVPELSRQVKNEEYVVLDDFNSLKLQSSYKIYTSPNYSRVNSYMP